jgi:hypothetical protein
MRRQPYLWIVLCISLVINAYLIYQAVDTFQETQKHAVNHVRGASWSLWSARLRLQNEQEAGWENPETFEAIAEDFQIVRMRLLAAHDIRLTGEMWSEQQARTIWDGANTSHAIAADGNFLARQAQNLYEGAPVRRDALDSVLAQHETAQFPNPNDWEDDAAFMNEVCQAIRRYRLYDLQQAAEDWDDEPEPPFTNCELY